jgi:hypothetical protein
MRDPGIWTCKRKFKWNHATVHSWDQSLYFNLKNLFVFWDSSHYVAQAGFELLIFQPQPPEFWDYRYELSACYFIYLKYIILKKYKQLKGWHSRNHVPVNVKMFNFIFLCIPKPGTFYSFSILSHLPVRLKSLQLNSFQTRPLSWHHLALSRASAWPSHLEWLFPFFVTSCHSVCTCTIKFCLVWY